MNDLGLVTATALEVAYLGPEGTYSHIAALCQFGQSAQYFPESSITGAFRTVAGPREGCVAVVPLLNSGEGLVAETLENLVSTPGRIVGEAVLPISHCLVAHPRSPGTRIERLYSHPHAIAQCRAWLTAALPGIDICATASTAEGARRVAADPAGAAIASSFCAALYGLAVVERDIQDRADNVTRFAAVSVVTAGPTGHDRTAFAFTVPEDEAEPARLLDFFVQPVRLEVRGWQGAAFYAEVEGHRGRSEVRALLEGHGLSPARYEVVGSYPRAVKQESLWARHPGPIERSILAGARP